MKIRKPSERIRAAIKAAAERLAKAKPPMEQTLGTPGDLYVFAVPDFIKNEAHASVDEIGIEWLVVREHPKDPNWVLLAPIDNFSLIGSLDIVLSCDEPMTVRCGQADWFPKAMCERRLRVGAISDASLALVKKRLAEIARNQLSTNPNMDDDDANYKDHITLIEKVRQTLLESTHCG